VKKEKRRNHNMSSDNDNYLMFAVDSCSQDVISSNPYWSMTDSQRAEWKVYSRARLQQQEEEEKREVNEEENENSNSDADDEDADNNNDDDDEFQQDAQDTTAPTPDISENNDSEKPVAKQDKRKMWVTYQAWARQTLKEQYPDQKKFPLTEVNKLARTAWAEDGWAK
jgi:hypothetical protein